MARYKFIGHSTVLIEVSGTRFITDPIVSGRALVVPRKRPAVYRDEDLSGIDHVLLSHAHWDHLDRPTLRKIARRGRADVICPAGHQSLLDDLGFTRIVEMSSSDELRLGEFSIRMTPVNHRGRRWLERYRSSGGFFVRGPGHSFWFAGDTGYRSDFNRTMAGNVPDVALIPIGAYEPKDWYQMMHMGPEDALQAFSDVRAQFMLPIHWGAFKLTKEGVNDPPQVLRALVKGRPELYRRIFWLEPGQEAVCPDAGENLDTGVNLGLEASPDADAGADAEAYARDGRRGDG